MAATAAKQDMPPPGGFKPLDYSRIPARSVIGGKTLLLANLAITAGALYIYSLTRKRVERENIELRSASFAVTPLLVAERDREYLKQLRRNREAEEKLMADVEGWEVGKYKGEPIYKTIPEDTLVKPMVNEYFAHSEPKFLGKFKHIRLWD